MLNRGPSENLTAEEIPASTFLQHEAIFVELLRCFKRVAFASDQSSGTTRVFNYAPVPPPLNSGRGGGGAVTIDRNQRSHLIVKQPCGRYACEPDPVVGL